MQLTNKTFFISGASDGIGRATSIECAKRGATVIIHGKTQPKLELLYDEIVNQGYAEPVIYPLDFEKMTPDDCETLNTVIHKEFGQLDGLFNNAGWLGALTPIQQYDMQLWHRVIQINLNATMMLTQACLSLLNHDAKSSIVFNLDDKTSAYWGAYGAAKAGLTALVKILADEVANTNISVTGLLPGTVSTNLRTRAFPGEDPTDLTKAEEVGKAAAFLLTEQSHNINNKTSNGEIFQLSDLSSHV